MSRRRDCAVWVTDDRGASLQAPYQPQIVSSLAFAIECCEHLVNMSLIFQMGESLRDIVV